MKKILKLLALITILSTGANADKNKYGSLFYVKNFYANSEHIDQNLKQKATKLSNSCGLTSLLFANSHYSKQRAKKYPSSTSTKQKSKDAVKRLYNYLGLGYSSTVHFDSLRSIVKKKWKWKTVKRRSPYSSIDTNIKTLQKDIEKNRLALVVLDSNFIKNPTKNNVAIDHIVIVYAYQKRKDTSGRKIKDPKNNGMNDRIYFYDPYFGKSGYFKKSEIYHHINLTNFSFLAIAP